MFLFVFALQDVCDSRVVRFARVGRLAPQPEDQSGGEAAALAAIADSAPVASTSASAAPPSAALAVDSQPSPASKRIKQQQHEQPT